MGGCVCVLRNSLLSLSRVMGKHLWGCWSLPSIRKGLGERTWCTVMDYLPKDLFWRKQGLIPCHILPCTPMPLPTSRPGAGSPLCPGTLSPGRVGAGIGVFSLRREGTETFLRAALQTRALALPSARGLFRCPLSPTSGLGLLVGFFCRSAGAKCAGSQLCLPQILGERGGSGGKEMS